LMADSSPGSRVLLDRADRPRHRADPLVKDQAGLSCRSGLNLFPTAIGPG
jgi:hypothetical protein